MTKPLAPKRIASGVEVLRVALPARVVPVNVYLLHGTDGSVTIVDTGIATLDEHRWRATLASAGISPAAVERIVITHHHPDHVGGAGPLHAATGAPVVALAATVELAPLVWGDAGRIDAFFADTGEHLRRHGAHDSQRASLGADLHVARMAVNLPPDEAWQTTTPGDVLQVGTRNLHVIAAPGHADGHLLLLDENDGTLVAGDHLLEHISPAVGQFPHHKVDPLGSYLDSLRRTVDLDARQVLPGHGSPFSGHAARATELLKLHEQRLDTCLHAVAGASGDGIHAARVAEVLFSSALARASATDADIRFAMTETIAHLEHLRARRAVDRVVDPGGAFRYVVAGRS